MRHRFILPLFLGLLLSQDPLQGSAATSAQPGAAAATSYFVAPNGNDLWSGRRATPNWRRSDGPFSSIPRALQAAREARRRSSAQPGPVHIVLRGGRYELSEPVVLRPEDSGLSLEAYGGETPVLSGGRAIGGWKAQSLDGRPLWVAEVPQVRDGNWFFRELWVNGSRAVRARHPSHGYFGLVELLDSVPTWTEGHRRFRFKAGDLKWWKTATEADVVVMDRWVESRLPVFSIDEAEHIITFSKRSVFQLGPGDLYYLEGAFEVLDEPGEWYLDRHAGKVYYWPRAGETLKRLEVVAPVLSQVLRLEGQPDRGAWVQDIAMRGLSFAHSEWCFPSSQPKAEKPESIATVKPEVGGFGQAAIGVPAAVWGEGVRQCLFENCAFSHLGTYGLELARGCQSNRVLRCDFFDLGAGGIKLGECSLRQNPAEQARANEVSNCHVHDGGKMFASAIGIWLGQTADNLLTQNLVHDFFYTGISIGWTWGYGPALASNNVVAFNHVHHIGVKSDGEGPILSDMGGIYTLGRQPGTLILNNLWHDIAGLRYGGWGIYFDEGSSGILAQSNVVYRTTHGGLHQHYGATNQVFNNVFALARDHQVQRTRPEEHSSFSFQTNIVYFNSGVLLGGDWAGDHYTVDQNLYFDARTNASAQSLRFEKATLEQWRQRGHDLHSRVADPLFVAPQRNDFSLQPESPARALGFQPIDLKAVGPQAVGKDNSKTK